MLTLEYVVDRLVWDVFDPHCLRCGLQLGLLFIVHSDFQIEVLSFVPVQSLLQDKLLSTQMTLEDRWVGVDLYVASEVGHQFEDHPAGGAIYAPPPCCSLKQQ